MAKKSSAFEVTCPCCSAVLKVDADDEVVIGHTAPPRVKTFNDIEEAARAMKEQDTRRDSIFRQSVEAQKHASDVLEKKFQEAVKKAKETPGHRQALARLRPGLVPKRNDDFSLQ